MNPFKYSNIDYLVEYLEQHSGGNPTYKVRLATPFVEYINGFESIGQSTFKMRVQGFRALRRLFDQYRVIDMITWAHNNMKVVINCKERSLYIETGSTHFLQVCRHTMTGQGLSKITVDLNPL